ncbi:HDOD domain-containing protein [Hydrogenimonas sp.]
MRKELIEQIEHIPTLPESIGAIERVYADKESSVADMAKAIESDPTMAANILKLANSPLYGLSREVTTIQQAVSLLGKDTVRNFAIHLAASSAVPIDVSPYGISAAEYAKRVEVVSALLNRWLSKADRSRLGSVGLAAFLSDIGEVVISHYLENQGLSEAFGAVLKEKGKEEAEMQVCGSRSTDVAATLFHKWHFSSDIVHLVRFAASPDDAGDDETAKGARYLHIAKTVAGTDGQMKDADIKSAYAMLEEYGLEEEPFENALNAVLNL